MRKIILSTMSCALALSGCASTGSLRGEIADLERKLDQAEAKIDNSTAAIGAAGKTVNLQLGYRPIVNWAQKFSQRSADDRTIRFQQTARDGSLYEVEHECKFSFPSWHRRDGKRAWIHEARSTRVALEIKSLKAVPQSDGLRIEAPMSIDGKTQVGANYRVACGPSVGTNIGVTAEATPESVFALKLAKTEDGPITYQLALVSPSSIGLEMRALFQWFRVGFTIPIKNLAQTLGSGEINMLLGQEGDILLPDGTKRHYRIQTQSPTFVTDTQGMRLSSDIVIAVDPPAS